MRWGSDSTFKSNIIVNKSTWCPNKSFYLLKYSFNQDAVLRFLMLIIAQYQEPNDYNYTFAIN